MGIVMILRPRFLRSISALSQVYLRTIGDTTLVSQCRGIGSATYFSNTLRGIDLIHKRIPSSSLT
jgi:hypothetical protein